MKARRRLCLAASLLVIVTLLVVGCAREAPEPYPAAVSGVSVPEHPKDFPESLRWLTDEEKARLIEIALNTPKARESLEKGNEFTTRISWAALMPSSVGEGYSGYQIFDYEIVAVGIPRGVVDITPEGSQEKVVSVGVPEEAEIFPCVHIYFDEPPALIVMAAIDLETEETVYVDYYPRKRGPVRPTKTPPSEPPENTN